MSSLLPFSSAILSRFLDQSIDNLFCRLVIYIYILNIFLFCLSRLFYSCILFICLIFSRLLSLFLCTGKDSSKQKLYVLFITYQRISSVPLHIRFLILIRNFAVYTNSCSRHISLFLFPFGILGFGLILCTLEETSGVL